MNEYKAVRDVIVRYMKMDSNSDNMITFPELCAGLKKEKNYLAPAVVFELFKSFDVNKDGKVSVKELEGVLTVEYLATLAKSAQDSLEKIFKDFDANKDQQLSYEECLNLFKANVKYYQEWTDWAFDVVGKTKKDKLTKDDVVLIHMKIRIDVDNNPVKK